MDKYKEKLKEAGYDVTLECVKEVGNRKVIMSIPVNFSDGGIGHVETFDYHEGYWYCMSLKDFRDRDRDDVVEQNAKFLEGAA